MELTINDVRLHETRKKFKHIPLGSVFETSPKGKFFLKVNDAVLSYGLVSNAICLTHDEDYMGWKSFDDDTLVTELSGNLYLYSTSDKILTSVKDGGQNW